MPDAAARILVDDVDQLGDRMPAVADHVPRHALGDRHQFVVDHQHAMVHSLDKALDQNAAPTGALQGRSERRCDLVAVDQVDRHPAAMIGVQRLDHHRVSDPVGRAHRLTLRSDHPLLRHRQPQVAQKVVRILLVTGNLDPDVRRLAGDRGLDPLLEPAMAELHERVIVQAQPGDLALFGGLYQRRGARPELLALRESDEFVPFSRKIEALLHFIGKLGLQRLGEQAQQKLARDAGRLEPHVLLLVLEHHVVVPRRSGAAGLAERDVGAGHVLEFDRRVLPDVRHPGALVLAQAAQEAARLAIGTTMPGEARQRLGQARDELLTEFDRGPVLQRADIDLMPNDAKVSVETGPYVDVGVQDPHGARPVPVEGQGILPPLFAHRQTPGQGPDSVDRGPAGLGIELRPSGEHVQLQTDQRDGCGAAHVAHR